MRTPYIGITDFTSIEEVLRMHRVFMDHVGSLQRSLMVGVMMSYKTLRGLPSEWSSIFPRNGDVANIFLPLERVLNTLHYADYHNLEVADSLERATAFGGPEMHALQLDMTWPNAQVVRAYKEHHPEVALVLQVGNTALVEAENDPVHLCLSLGEYGDALSYVLLDKSMGRGRGMSAEVLRPFVEEVSAKLPDLGIAVAGGLGPKTLHLVEPLIRDYPHVSLDAQGKLRPSGSARDPVHWDMAEEYLVRALQLFTVDERPG